MKKNTLLIVLLATTLISLFAVETESETQAEIAEFQTIEMTVDRHGWKPSSFTLKKGIPVKWEINVQELTYCNDKIVVPDYKLEIELQKGQQIVEFTPRENGEINWSCWMDMIPGSFIVSEDGNTTETKQKQDQQKPKSCCPKK